MTKTEQKAAISLSSLYALRMLGLFMILPVFVLFADSYEAATPALVGLAVGIYGLTQALCQIPLGALSDRIGRKPILIGGLLVFAFGSLIAAMADHIAWVIVGRFLQGTGAIASTLMALAADLSRPAQRTKIMAVIGISIGMSFSLALILGPWLAGQWGVSGIFWFTAALAIAGVGVVYYWVPSPQAKKHHVDTEVTFSALFEVFQQKSLMHLNLGIFILHLSMMALFMVVPLTIQQHLGDDPSRHVGLYLSVLVCAFVCMVPAIILAEKRGLMKPMFLLAIALLLIGQYLIWQAGDSWSALVMGLVLYFTGFNFLEASLPSLVSKLAHPARKGTAMGLYSSCQFMGAFLGAWLAGILTAHYGAFGAMAFSFGLIAVWWLVSLSMTPPGKVKTQLIAIPAGLTQATALQNALESVPGVIETEVAMEEKVAYLKVDQQQLDPSALDLAIESLSAQKQYNHS